MSFLELSNIRRQFGPTVAVENFDLQMSRAEPIWLLRPLGVLLTGHGQTQPEGAH